MLTIPARRVHMLFLAVYTDPSLATGVTLLFLYRDRDRSAQPDNQAPSSFTSSHAEDSCGLEPTLCALLSLNRCWLELLHSNSCVPAEPQWVVDAILLAGSVSLFIDGLRLSSTHWQENWRLFFPPPLGQFDDLKAARVFLLFWNSQNRGVNKQKSTSHSAVLGNENAVSRRAWCTQTK